MPAFRLNGKFILFLHIPKAGGTSIEEWLSAHGSKSLYQKHRPEEFPCVPQHFHGAMIDSLFAPDVFDYSFCVTRNPYARLLSEYNYRITRPRLKNRILPKPSLDAWVSRAVSGFGRDPFVHSNHIRPQHEFMIDATEAFRLEDGLDPLRDKLRTLTGLTMEADVPHRNPSVKTASQLTQRAAEKIRDFYIRDFELFGYDPDNWQNP